MSVRTINNEAIKVRYGRAVEDGRLLQEAFSYYYIQNHEFAMLVKILIEYNSVQLACFDINW